jgi:hypothetical protein
MVFPEHQTVIALSLLAALAYLPWCADSRKLFTDDAENSCNYDMLHFCSVCSLA